MLYQLRRGIVYIDMHLRDERVLEWLRSVTAHGAIPVTYDEIGNKFLCHRRTARAILHRLESARLVIVKKDSKRGGYLYYAPRETKLDEAG